MLPLLACKAKTFWQISLMVPSCNSRIQTLNLGMVRQGFYHYATAGGMQSKNVLANFSNGTKLQ
jgi:hypothetical protein